MNHQYARDAAAELAYPHTNYGSEYILVRPGTPTLPPREPRVDYTWQDHAACKGIYGVFHPVPHESPAGAAAREAKAKAICADCPVADACAQAGAVEPWGVWAGREVGAGKRRIVPDELRGRRGQPRALNPIEHGTLPGYRQHIRRYPVGHPERIPCDACRAVAVENRKKYRADESQVAS